MIVRAVPAARVVQRNAGNIVELIAQRQRALQMLDPGSASRALRLGLQTAVKAAAEGRLQAVIIARLNQGIVAGHIRPQADSEARGCLSGDDVVRDAHPVKIGLVALREEVEQVAIDALEILAVLVGVVQALAGQRWELAGRVGVACAKRVGANV